MLRPNVIWLRCHILHIQHAKHKRFIRFGLSLIKINTYENNENDCSVTIYGLPVV
jgi:hypothetical protein